MTQAVAENFKERDELQQETKYSKAVQLLRSSAVDGWTNYSLTIKYLKVLPSLKRLIIPASIIALQIS